MKDLGGVVRRRGEVEAFLRELNELCSRHQVAIDCAGYECEGIVLRFGEVRGELELSGTFSWPTLRRT